MSSYQSGDRPPTGARHRAPTHGGHEPPRVPQPRSGPSEFDTLTLFFDDVTPTQAAARHARHSALGAQLAAAWLVALLAAAGAIAVARGWVDFGVAVPRTGAAVGTWLAVVAVVHRLGGRPVPAGGFAAVVLAVATGLGTAWALAASAALATTAYAVLGIIVLRPASGLRALRELAVALGVAAAGALVVVGFGADVRPYRFRVLVLAVALAALALVAYHLASSRLPGPAALRWSCLVVAVLAALAVSRSLAGPGLPDPLAAAATWMSGHLGAVPSVAAGVVGIPALLLGLRRRMRSRDGWWLVALGGLAVAGVTTRLAQVLLGAPGAADTLWATIVVGVVLGLSLDAVGAVVLSRRRRSGRGGRNDSAAGWTPRGGLEPAYAESEGGRLAPLG
ncbi:MAG TPA: hypothetical protein VFI30_07095 [Nocardioidaceae bacterium]|nr:hypothetical protein [Nocardioidaceae bacterium]